MYTLWNKSVYYTVIVALFVRVLKKVIICKCHTFCIGRQFGSDITDGGLLSVIHIVTILTSTILSTCT